MEFLSKDEKKTSNFFIDKGYIVSKVESKKSLSYIRNKIKKIIEKKLKIKNKKIDLNKIHNFIKPSELNEFRLFIINKINEDNLIRYHYFNIAKQKLFCLVGNELMMQRNLNLSIQLPNDNSSLLPIHSDVWSGDSPFEINLWIPLVDCYATKSMYILDNKNNKIFNKKIKNNKIKNSQNIFEIVKKKLKWLKVKYGNFLIFDQTLPHGNVVNLEKETRWSLNCRFKGYFSPYGDKKLGEFFVPITTRAMTQIGMKYKYPFKN